MSFLSMYICTSLKVLNSHDCERGGKLQRLSVLRVCKRCGVSPTMVTRDPEW